MGITIVIVSGVFLCSAVASLFGYLEKKKGRNDTRLETRIDALEATVKALEESSREKDERFGKLETDVSFVSKLIEDRTAEKGS